ncbi:MAG: hypothetical protein ACRC91_02390 [Aeromonas sp.]
MIEVGSKVRISHKLKDSNFRDRDDMVVYPMRKFAGEVATVIQVREKEYGTYYRLDIDNNYWNWPSDTIDLVEV